MGLKIEIVDSTEKAGLLSERKHRRVMRQVLREMLVYWLQNLAPKHFTTKAYTEYSQAYGVFKKKKRGKPLVRKGRLKARVLSRGNERRIRGTFRRATMRIPFGRPSKFTKKEIEASIFIEMNKHSLSYREAQRKVYRKAGYGRKQAQVMATMIRAMSDREMETLAKFGGERYLELAREIGKKRRVRV